jgi:hypothetical protein
MSHDEKRSYERYQIWFPVTLKTDRGEVWAICRDASPGGVLVSAVSPLELGATVTAVFRVTPTEKEERSLLARVVRQEVNEGELMLVFPYRAALELTPAVPELLEALACHAATRA